MKLYGLKNAPNPRRVKIFLAEKKISLPLEELDIETREHKAPAFLAKNSLGQLPVLELDDGTILCESVAICRYFEEMVPEPPLFGRSALERAQVEMWNRRMELELLLPVIDMFVRELRERGTRVWRCSSFSTTAGQTTICIPASRVFPLTINSRRTRAIT